MDLLSKFHELHGAGHPLHEIVENIFLNYNAYTNNDDIYFIKKLIANEFKVEINNVKLIGSSHTGFKNFEPRDITKDYDFAIIDPFLFREYLLEIDINKLNKQRTYNYTNNLSKGKIHVLYAPKEVKEKIENKLENVKSSIYDIRGIKIDKSISVCFYVSERAFIKNLCDYFTKEISKSMEEDKVVNNNITTAIKSVEKIS